MTGEWEIHIHDRGGAKAKRCQVMKDFDETIAAVSAFKNIACTCPRKGDRQTAPGANRERRDPDFLIGKLGSGLRLDARI
jgi:hypothetical protein